ncbi:hypothetical protein BDQ17DRAFT_1433772 [Cyathus striatus]|nr:hypothetical protein BDQ17DRAFT_1433772 [Cyathus striatus]
MLIIEWTIKGTAVYYLYYFPPSLQGVFIDVQLDDNDQLMTIPPTSVGSSTTFCSQNILFGSSELSDSTHTLTVTLMGRASENSNDLACLPFMGLIITTTDDIGTPTPPSTSNSPSTLNPNTGSNSGSNTGPTNNTGHPSSSRLSTGLVIGIVCAAVGGLLILAGVAWFVGSYRKKFNSTVSQPGSSIINYIFGSTINNAGKDQKALSEKHALHKNSQNQTSSRNIDSYNPSHSVLL